MLVNVKLQYSAAHSTHPYFTLDPTAPLECRDVETGMRGEILEETQHHPRSGHFRCPRFRALSRRLAARGSRVHRIARGGAYFYRLEVRGTALRALKRSGDRLSAVVNTFEMFAVKRRVRAKKKTNCYMLLVRFRFS